LIVAWRLTKARHAATAFDGEGARIGGGRWNPDGIPVVYLADHPALAVLEMFVHLKGAATRIKFVLFRVEIPAEVTVRELLVPDLPVGWREEPPGPKTMSVGEKWVREGRTSVLKVPSALVPAAANLVLNPRHKDFPKIRIGSPEKFSFDPRMWK
jgi:RES domain-containing protein